MATTAERLTEIWETPRGIAGTLFTVDHKEIGKHYLITSFIFLLAGGIEALILRVQLAVPQNNAVDPHTYDQVFTMHGTTMIFLVAVPIIIGSFGNYMIPLMVGARDMAFPRLNALSYWVFLFGGLLLYGSFIVGSPANDGWFAYVPLSTQNYTPGPNQDFWSFALLLLTISTTASAVNFIVTVFKMRAPGMSINRLPLFVWSEVVTAFLIIFGYPPLTVAAVFLELQRKFGFHFFDSASGGNAVLWQHLFWLFGHPVVYIIFLPAVGTISALVPVFSRRPMVGYIFVALSSVAIGFLSFGVWAHHMFTVGMPQLAQAFFSAGSMMVSIPSAVTIFAWLATIVHGRWVFKTASLYVLGFLWAFMIGGISGVVTGATSFDWQINDTYFVVAHIHYIVAGSVLFALFAGIYYWLPKMTGHMLSEMLGWIGFWIFFIGFNLGFFPMHILGLLGMPRRWYTYPATVGWGSYNMAETIGSFIMAAGILVIVVDILQSLVLGEAAPDNPWGGDSLEWAVSSPPPPYNFLNIPVVRSREPLWDQPELARINEVAETPAETLAPAHIREAVATSVLDADQREVIQMPGDSPWPLFVAFGLLWIFVGFLPDVELAQLIIIPIGFLIVTISLFGWFWPPRRGPLT